MLSPQRLLEIIRAEIESNATTGGKRLLVFWFTVDDGVRREHFADEFRSAAGSVNFVPLVIRQRLFEIANAVQSDIAELLDRNKQYFDTNQSTLSAASPLCIILISRSEFKLSQASSPFMPPSWFPVRDQGYIEIIDLSKKGKIKLDAPEVELDALSKLLYDLEKGITARLRRMITRDPLVGRELMAYAGGTPPLALADVLSNTEQTLTNTLDPCAYRTQYSKKSTILCLLIWMTNEYGLEKLDKIAKALTQALGWHDTIRTLDMIPRSLAWVVFRPAGKHVRDVEMLLGRSLMLSVYAAHQVVTASKHGDEYGAFPEKLLSSFSYDLRQCLSELVQLSNR